MEVDAEGCEGGGGSPVTLSSPFLLPLVSEEVRPDEWGVLASQIRGRTRGAGKIHTHR
ncbi:hypothetical protein OOK29_48070 [Streptomyces phaeochromogenes]|uniref:hypothetical protein n=1 Tax=Streptomyces phaeochromogenes TaxID=1923 RepID=UPI002250E183|nr:hypothetical protein [Streptomyces phaeochromogenes]MCX5605885.1 hypothetical protein [Streptomyces phaeochromogenes]